MSTTPSPQSPAASTMTDEQLSELATEFVLAMMASASTDKIRPMDWWERARTALELSASASENAREMVTRFARRIHAETLTAATTARLSCLSSIEDAAAFARFRRVVARESTYIVGFAQQQRAEQRAEAEATKVARAPAEERAAVALEELRLLKIDRDLWRNRARDEAENARVALARLKEIANDQH